MKSLAIIAASSSLTLAIQKAGALTWAAVLAPVAAYAGIALLVFTGIFVRNIVRASREVRDRLQQ